MPSKTKVVEMVHYDEKLIYTDPTYRFKYLAEFCDFGKADVDALHQAAPVVDPLVPAIVDAVYEKLLHFDTTKSVFLQRNDGYNGKMVTKLEDLKWDDPQLGFRKDFLAKYVLITAMFIIYNITGTFASW